MLKNLKKPKRITAEEFDAMVERGDDIMPYMDFENAIVVRRVNVDFPDWMIKNLDREAQKLNISRQAVIKMWLSDRMSPPRTKKKAR
jgi:hypothetical protein